MVLDTWPHSRDLLVGTAILQNRNFCKAARKRKKKMRKKKRAKKKKTRNLKYKTEHLKIFFFFQN